MTAKRKHALITGGGSGIGLAIARRLSENQIDVTIAGRSVERLAATELPHVKMDVTDDASIRQAIAECAPIDIMVACAGAATTTPALKTSQQIWDDMIAVNLTSVYHCAQATLPQMVERGWGRFIAIASTASLKGYAYCGAYAAAKHGVLGWIKTLAIELAKTGVTCNAVCPGFTDTPLITDAVETIIKKTGCSEDEAVRSFTGANPMERLVAPEEVADAVLWLASPTSASTNGQAIAIDGGETAQ